VEIYKSEFMETKDSFSDVIPKDSVGFYRNRTEAAWAGAKANIRQKWMERENGTIE
jgi:hypothetical protein